ncbi:MAG: CarD family transcriptional regulator [Lachnospiraceae bacterium]|nr:CarD family transcriptional regulator [Lachnospiraceae bacterium]
MFEIGEYIIYGTKGVCQVMDITTMNLDGVPKDTKYYILQPWNQSGSRIFVSVDNQKTIMRKILTKEEANALIDKIPEIEEIWVDNDKVREEKYKECIRTCECSELVRIIKTLYLRREERLKAGKKITTTDERYLKSAEEHLYTELSVALDIPVENMEKYITEKVEKVNIL